MEFRRGLRGGKVEALRIRHYDTCRLRVESYPASLSNLAFTHRSIALLVSNHGKVACKVVAPNDIPKHGINGRLSRQYRLVFSCAAIGLTLHQSPLLSKPWAPIPNPRKSFI